jgi:predicted permease
VVWNELAYSVRQLRKNPGVTLTVVATLGLCIGANTAIYSVVDAVLVRPLPYPQPDRLAMIGTHVRSPRGEEAHFGANGTLWEAVHRHATDLDSAAIGGESGVNLAANGQVQYVQQSRVSADYFRVLGIPPELGRSFTSVEDTPGGPPVTVLSYALWQRLFHGDPSVVGKALTLRGEPFTVVGVMPRDFPMLTRADLWTPLRPSTTGEGVGINYGIVARLKPGITWAQGSSQLQVVAREALPSLHVSKEISVDFRLASLQRGLTDNIRNSLTPAWIAALAVLLIGCVNIAGLLLARAAHRSREIATRMALGASRAAIVRQLFFESVLLALAGGALGAWLGSFGIYGLKLLGARGFHLWRPVALDARVLGATLLIAIVTSLLFGLLPALETSRLDIRSVLVEGGRSASGGKRRRSRALLVVAEIALGFVLLIGAGLMIRTLAYLSGLNPGFDARDVFTAQLSLQDARYGTSAAVNKLFDQSLERIRELPGVESAAVGLSLPYQTPLNDGFEILDGPNKGMSSGTDMVYVTPGYFETLRMQLVAGRRFSDLDSATSQHVAIVNQAFVNRYLKQQGALGSHLKLEGPTDIVGIVGNIQQSSNLGGFGPLAATPTVYVPAAQTTDAFLQLIHTWFSPNWVVRTHAGASIAGKMQKVVQSIDPQLPFASFHSMSDIQAGALTGQRYRAVLFSVFAGLALLLAALGVYGLMAHAVTERTREIGIRMALGATLRHVLVAVIGSGIRLAVFGVAIGALLALFASRLLQRLVWGVTTMDALTFAGVGVLLLTVAAAASLLPSLRIVRLDPAQTLHEE